MDFAIRIADRNILICGASAFLQRACKNYLAAVGENPDVWIRIDESMIRAEAERYQQKGENLSMKAAESILVPSSARRTSTSL